MPDKPTAEQTMQGYLQEYYEYLSTSAEEKKQSFEKWMEAKAKAAASAEVQERVEKAMPVLAVGAALAGALVVGRIMTRKG